MPKMTNMNAGSAMKPRNRPTTQPVSEAATA